MSKVSLAVFATLVLLPSLTAAQVITSDMNDESQWDVLGDDDSEAVFGFDYAPFGIPAPPGGGDDTTGIRLSANIETGAAQGIAVSPKGFMASGQYTVSADVWLNSYSVVGPGTTEHAGIFVGYEGVDSGIHFGTGILADTDGDAAELDFVLYSDGEQIAVETGQYEAESRDSAADLYVDAFPGQAVPNIQTDPNVFDPPNEPVVAMDGTLAFAWHTFRVDVDSARGIANFSIDDVLIGTLDAAEQALVLEGPIALAMTDLFTSISPGPEFAFHVFDNLVVIQQGGLLQAGDADQDFDFDQLDLVKVQIGAKYLSGAAATWGEGDWNGAPGGEQGNPPAGDGLFDQLDIIEALNNGLYLTGPYAAIADGGVPDDGQTSVIYNAATGEVAVDATADTELTSINIDSSGGIFTGEAAQNLGGSFDNDADGNIFKATFGGSFGSMSFGNVAQTGLAKDFVLNDLTVVGSLAGGGALGDVDLVYIPEPSSLILAIGAALGCFGLIHRRVV